MAPPKNDITGGDTYKTIAYLTLGEREKLTRLAHRSDRSLSGAMRRLIQLAEEKA
jgi:hypothetical protein